MIVVTQIINVPEIPQLLFTPITKPRTQAIPLDMYETTPEIGTTLQSGHL